MSYVRQTLAPDEKIIFRSTLHWSVYGPVISMCVLLFIFAEFWMVIVPILVLLFLCIYMRVRTTEMAVTDRRVIYKTGIFTVTVSEMSVNKIESCIVLQSFFDRGMDMGTVKISGVGSESITMKQIESPLDFRRAVASQSFDAHDNAPHQPTHIQHASSFDEVRSQPEVNHHAKIDY